MKNCFEATVAVIVDVVVVVADKDVAHEVLRVDVVAVVVVVDATLDTVSDQGDSDAEPAIVHTVAATEHTSPDTASVLLRFVVLCCQKSLMWMLRHMRLNWVLVQEGGEVLKRNRIVLAAVEAAVLPGCFVAVVTERLGRGPGSSDRPRRNSFVLLLHTVEPLKLEHNLAIDIAQQRRLLEEFDN